MVDIVAAWIHEDFPGELQFDCALVHYLQPEPRYKYFSGRRCICNSILLLRVSNHFHILLLCLNNIFVYCKINLLKQNTVHMA